MFSKEMKMSKCVLSTMLKAIITHEHYQNLIDDIVKLI